MKKIIIKILLTILLITGFSSSIYSSSFNNSNDYNLKIEANTYYSPFPSGGGADSVWQMKTYYETVTLNANQLRMLENDLQLMRTYLEQIKKLPENLMLEEIAKHSSMINELIQIQNTAKDILKDAREFENYYKTVYSDVQNMDYISLLDRYASTVNDLSYNAMQTSNMGNKVSKNAGENAKYLMQQTRSTQNPIQLLEVISKWNSNLSYQINSISDMINSSNRLQILEAQQKASEIQVSRQQQENALKILQERKKQIERRMKK